MTSHDHSEIKTPTTPPHLDRRPDIAVGGPQPLHMLHKHKEKPAPYTDAGL